MSHSYKNLANAIRALSMDAIQKANSGHPGAPLGMADMAEAVWRGFMRHNPTDPKWCNRDRFVLSNGHASMLIYSLLHLTGYDLSIDDIKNFRQLHSKTPGHPEYGIVPGVETTTGPLGQGISNAVGMAMAEAMLSDEFNKPGFDIVDHYTYTFMGDGCLMEGISHEACSIAGTLGLGKLIALYDSNGISIDGEVKNWFGDDTKKRFESYNWQVLEVDGHDGEALRKAITEAQSDKQHPSLIICHTTIGFGSPNKAGTSASHGAPLGNEEIELTKKELGWNYGPFEIPKDVYAAWDFKEQGRKLEDAWNALFAKYKQEYPKEAAEFERRMSGKLVDGLTQKAKEFALDLQKNAANIATRKAGQNALDFFGALMPELVGGSADLAPSNLTMNKSSKSIKPGMIKGNYIHWGVREFAMAGAMNGMMLHGGYRPYGGTFLIFSEYARNAIRMSALMGIPTMYVFTHDSIGVGEDGPTHEPIEQTSTLRLVPNLHTWRPCDQVETAMAYLSMIERKDGPSDIVLTRQNLEQMERSSEQVEDILRGGYILKDGSNNPDLIIIATGSEVGIAFHAANELEKEGKSVRVVSMPCAEIFDSQSQDYKDKVLPPSCTKRIAVEAGSTALWYKYVGLTGKVLGLDRYGESAPAGQLFELFGFTTENVVKIAKSVL